MGLYDREYYREGGRYRVVNPLGPSWRTSATTWFIAINVAVFFVQIILEKSRADRILYCSPQSILEDFQLWRLLTAAFCHDTRDLWHLFFNMLVLVFFGTPIEQLYGRRNFVAFYLMVAVVANLVYCIVPYALGGPTFVPTLGASGCCMALVVLCAFYYPTMTVILFFVPMPLWALAAFYVASDLFGFLRADPNAQIAYSVHLGGALLGFLYWRFDLRLTTLQARLKGFRRPRRAAPPAPADGIPRFLEDVENQRLDRLLEKIGRFGRESLTDEELEFLNRMSNRYRGQR